MPRNPSQRIQTSFERLIRFAALAPLLLACGAARADWQFGFEAARTHDSNLPRAQLRSDKIGRAHV